MIDVLVMREHGGILSYSGVVLSHIVFPCRHTIIFLVNLTYMCAMLSRISLSMHRRGPHVLLCYQTRVVYDRSVSFVEYLRIMAKPPTCT